MHGTKHEDGGSMFIRNIGIRLPEYSTSYSTRTQQEVCLCSLSLSLLSISRNVCWQKWCWPSISWFCSIFFLQTKQLVNKSHGKPSDHTSPHHHTQIPLITKHISTHFWIFVSYKSAQHYTRIFGQFMGKCVGIVITGCKSIEYKEAPDRRTHRSIWHNLPQHELHAFCKRIWRSGDRASW